MPVLATGATQKEYSSELGPKNYSKMEPKMDETVIQKENISKITKNSLFAAIYYTLAMSTTSKKTTFGNQFDICVDIF